MPMMRPWDSNSKNDKNNDNNKMTTTTITTTTTTTITTTTTTTRKKENQKGVFSYLSYAHAYSPVPTLPFLSRKQLYAQITCVHTYITELKWKVYVAQVLN